jgi:hypothetical protein
MYVRIETIFKHIVTCIPITSERLGKQACNKYSTNNRVYPFLGNARNTSTQQWNRCRRRCFLCGSHLSIAEKGCVFCAVARPESIQREANNNWQFSCSSVQFSRQLKVSLWKDDFMCPVVTVRLLWIHYQDATNEDWENLASSSDLWSNYVNESTIFFL